MGLKRLRQQQKTTSRICNKREHHRAAPKSSTKGQRQKTTPLVTPDTRSRDKIKGQDQGTTPETTPRDKTTENTAKKHHRKHQSQHQRQHQGTTSRDKIEGKGLPAKKKKKKGWTIPENTISGGEERINHVTLT